MPKIAEMERRLVKKHASGKSYCGVRPMRDQLLLRRVRMPEASDAMLPPAALADKLRLSQWGVVLAMGPDADAVTMGSLVLMSKQWGGADVQIAGNEPLVVLSQKWLAAVIDP